MSRSKKFSMSRKMKRQLTALVAFLVFAGAGTFAWLSNADAKTPTVTKKSPAAMMARYSNKGQGTQKAKDNIRVSRLSQMNIVSEASNVLNMLPIKIMEEMKKGKTLEQIAKQKGMSKDQFLKKMSAFEDKTVAAAVKAGKITEKHQKALKEGQKDRLTKSLKLKAMDVNDHAAMDMGN